MKIVHVIGVQVLGHLQLRLEFDDGLIRDVDISGLIKGPVFEPLEDPEFFKQVRVDDDLGTVVWPNGADLDPLVLHGDYMPADEGSA